MKLCSHIVLIAALVCAGSALPAYCQEPAPDPGPAAVLASQSAQMAQDAAKLAAGAQTLSSERAMELDEKLAQLNQLTDKLDSSRLTELENQAAAMADKFGSL